MIRNINFVNLFLVCVAAFLVAFGSAFADAVSHAKDWDAARVALLSSFVLGCKAVGVALMGFLTQRDKNAMEGEED
jgi:hypothetical protein